VTGLGEVLAGFRAATGWDAAVWLPAGDGDLPRVLDATRPVVPPPGASLPRAGSPPSAIEVDGGTCLVAGVPGPRGGWVVVGPTAEADRAAPHLAYLVPAVGSYLQATLEVEHAATELAERYEEINLLYAISEILGRTVSLEEGATTILRELSETVGAGIASILVLEPERDELQVVAAIGVDVGTLRPIAREDDCSVAAKVFDTLHPVIVPEAAEPCASDAPYRRGELLCVPIVWSGPRGASERLGVVNLSARPSGFTAGDLKLAAAIATQIGTAIQNSRLVRASIEQQRLRREMQLASELQLKLLPPASVLAPDARAAARVVPAESVGGDFYYLVRLGEGRVGVMVGDVSGHGYQAALIMALTMSAAAIHARSASDPGEMLRALRDSVRDELETTEMYVTAFYAVIDCGARRIRYANAGHPHAFVVRPSGDLARLAAIDPPVGMAEELHTAEYPWDPDHDMLVVFTDGISDVENRTGARLGEQAVLDAVRAEAVSAPQCVVDRVFSLVGAFADGVAPRDDLTFVAVRN